MSRPFRSFNVLWRPLALYLAFSALLSPAHSQSQPVSALCADGECQPAISATTYFDRPAYRLTDGITEAVVVPQIGRIMRFGKVGGPNMLWNSPTSAGINWGWINYGGDKNWLAPQSWWKTFHGKDNWPPDTAFDGQPYKDEVLTGGKLQITSPLSPTGIRFIRTLYFDGSGDFVIEQTAKKEKGPMVRASIWNITQAVPGQAIFLPLDPNSPYKDGYLLLQGKGGGQTMDKPTPSLLRITPSNKGGGTKWGMDSPVSTLASVRDGVAFVQKTDKPTGKYPDGADTAGFPVEAYINGNAKVFYCELEMLGPLKDFVVGSKSTHTLRWSLHDLPTADVSSPALVDVVEKLLYK